VQIDWVTVAAQIVNFLVLVWLLQRFLYRPITRAMARREERIRSRLESAEEKRQAADQEARDYRRKKAELEDRREEILDEAREEAKDLRARLEEEAREAVAREREDWHRQVEADREAFLRSLREGTARHVNAVARAALADLAEQDIEAEVAARFLEELSGLDPDEAAAIAGAAREAGGSVTVDSAYELPGAVKSRVTRAVHGTLGEDLEVAYRQDTSLLLGLRLRAGGRTLEWSLSSYLDRLEEAAADKLAKFEPVEGREAA